MLDKIVALMALLLLSPIFILISLVLFLLQKQIFFIQTRVGKDQTRFSIYKFQTMSLARDTNGKLLSVSGSNNNYVSVSANPTIADATETYHEFQFQQTRNKNS